MLTHLVFGLDKKRKKKERKRRFKMKIGWEHLHLYWEYA